MRKGQSASSAPHGLFVFALSFHEKDANHARQTHQVRNNFKQAES